MGLLLCSLVSDKGRKFSTLGDCFPNGEMVVPFAETPLDDLVGLLSLLRVWGWEIEVYLYRGEVLQRAVYWQTDDTTKASVQGCKLVLFGNGDEKWVVEEAKSMK